MRIRFHKIDGFISVFDRTKYLVLFGNMIPLTVGLGILYEYKTVLSELFLTIIQKLKLVHTILWLFIMLWYLPSQFETKIKNVATIIYS